MAQALTRMTPMSELREETVKIRAIGSFAAHVHLMPVQVFALRTIRLCTSHAVISQAYSSLAGFVV